VVDKWQFEVPSTKAAQAALDALGVYGRALIVLTREEEQAYKSLRNLTDVDLILVGELAAYDVLCSDWLVFSRETLPGNNVWAEAEVTEASVAAPKARPAPATAASKAGAGAAEETDEAEAPEAEAPEAEAAVAQPDEADEAPVTDGAIEPEESEGEEA
jgi:large subunit ribosomal protein L4